ncbi:MAG TPA: phosphoenolpyruvate synthase [Acidocella sp.]|jgi:pyruvate,water dikinase|nr:phosphoenolpyruvate synthase [Acidocella sp.]
MISAPYIRWFKDIRLGDIAVVGGKNASLGELHAACRSQHVRVPNGFALTAACYREALTQADAVPKLHELLDGLDQTDIARLAERAASARDIVYAATGGAELRQQIIAAYRQLEAESGPRCAVAVRSSATAEDLPNASFAGQHESYLNIRGDEAVVEACRRCFASLFTDRAIVYRINNGFDHFKVALSVGVMKMIRSDLGSSGVIFTLDTESGFRDAVLITGVYGLGETIVQGQADPDEFYVHKPTFKKGFRAVLRRSLGKKQLRMVYADASTGETTHKFPVTEADAGHFCINDAEVLKLAGYAIDIEDHYSAHAGYPMPMDIEWAKDGEDGHLYIVQARPETVVSQRSTEFFTSYKLTGTGPRLASGRAVGEKIVSGTVRVVADMHDLAAFQPGEVLVADTTSPDWEPVMKTAAAIVTNRGGRTCHAAIIARELGIAALVGATDVTRTLQTGSLVTVSCAEGDVGHIYQGQVAFETSRVPLAGVRHPKTAVMVNLGNPDIAFRSAMFPNDGVGLARMEFIISEHIGIHPMALASPEKVTDPVARAAIAKRVAHYRQPADFFVERLAEGVGTIAAAFYPKPVIVRLSDFKTNEYASLLGGDAFEPREDNPMLGFRGAARYAHPAYAAGFALECAALRRVRDIMGLTNLRIMVPFCRRVIEGQRVIEAMAEQGLKRGENGLEIYVMCEIPNNVIQIDAFAALFDGFSIGSNDLTQLTLGVDRDSEIVAFDFDENDPGMQEMFHLAVTGAKRNGRHVGICGEAPANDPAIARFLVELGIDSISVNPGSLIRTMTIVAETEALRDTRMA